MINYESFEIPHPTGVTTFHEFKESPWYGIKFYFTDIRPENPDDLKNLKGDMKLRFDYVILDTQGRNDLDNNSELDHQVATVLYDLVSTGEE